MFDFFDDDFEFEDFAIYGAIAGLFEEEEEERLTKHLDEGSDDILF